MQNKIEDLRNHLFAALERLNDDDLMGNAETAQNEIKRAKAIATVGKEIVESAKVEALYIAKLGITKAPTTFMLGEGKERE